jgi:multidrug efflux pump subunit AcrA (membrane-fusion protein)
MSRLLRRGPRGRVWAAVAALVVVAGVGTWLLTRGGASPAVAATTTAQATASTMKQTVSASGTIDAADTADLDFAVSGTVTSVLVAAGDHVKVGQALATIDPTALVAARAAAQASLTAADEQLTSDEDAGASAVQVAADKTAIVSAQASLDQASKDVDHATLRATIAGQVTSLNLAVGDVVGSSSGNGNGGNGNSGNSGSGGTGSSGSSSTSQVTITSTGSFVVDATVAAADVSQLKTGMQAQITATGVTDTIYGVVSSVGLVAQTSDSGAAVFPVTIKVTGNPSGVYAGTSATVAIIVQETPNVLTVPSRALKTSGSTTYVMKVVGGKAVRTTVTTGTTYGAETQVLSGLKDGDTVQVPGFTLPSGLSSRGTRSGNGGFGEGGFGGGGFGGGGGGGFGGGPEVFVQNGSGATGGKG